MGAILLPVVTSAKSIRPDSNSSRLMVILLPFVIVDDLDTPCLTITPSEAYPPLIVDADAELPAPIAVQGFEAVTRRNPEIVQPPCRVDRLELGPGAPLHLVGKIPDHKASEERGCALVGEAPDHDRTYRLTVRMSRPRRTAKLAGPAAR